MNGQEISNLPNIAKLPVAQPINSIRRAALQIVTHPKTGRSLLLLLPSIIFGPIVEEFLPRVLSLLLRRPPLLLRELVHGKKTHKLTAEIEPGEDELYFFIKVMGWGR